MAAKTKKILLRDVPEDIGKLIIKVKTEIMEKSNGRRTNVGDEEAIYKLIRNNK